MALARLAAAATVVTVAGSAFAQAPRPPRSGAQVPVTIDSTPQQAAIYLDDKKYGIVGYTPYAGKLAKGDWTLILELPGYKTVTMPIAVGDKREFFATLGKGAAAAGGSIEIQSAGDPNVAGATLFVDGQQRGTAPLVADVPEGRHLVEVKKPSFGDFAQWVAVKTGERVTLVPVLRGNPRGALLIDADVPGATVSVDGKRLADPTPVLAEGLDEGPHLVEVQKDAGPPWRQTVTVKAGARGKVNAELRQAAGGVLRVVASVAGAEISVDGAARGQAPVDVTGLPAGSHTVQARAPGFADQQLVATVVPGQTQEVRLELVPGVSGPSGKLRVTAPAAGAAVFVDGASVGTTPVEKDVAAGEHTIVVERDGQARFERKVTVPEGQTVAVAAEQSAVGGVRLLSTPDGASVLVDGFAAGRTPMVKTDLAAGEHVVTFRADGYRELAQSQTAPLVQTWSATPTRRQAASRGARRSAATRPTAATA